MPVLFVLTALLLLVAGSFVLAVLQKLSSGQRRKLLWWALAALGALASLVLVARFGVGGLAPAAIALVSAGRRLTAWAGVPLLSRLGRMLLQRRGPAASAGGFNPAGGGREAPKPRGGRMSRNEALQVLGLGEDASPQDVQREYRRLMKRLHPDQGGSPYLAAKVNEAHDVLLA